GLPDALAHAARDADADRAGDARCVFRPRGGVDDGDRRRQGDRLHVLRRVGARGRRRRHERPLPLEHVPAGRLQRRADRVHRGGGGWLGRGEHELRRLPGWARFLALAGLLALFPAVADDYWMRIGTVSLVFALLALGLNVSVGFAGLLDLGYIAYYGFGAYGYAMLSSSKFGVHWQAWASIPVVVAAAILLGFFLALPSRRLVGDYLAIVTLFFGQIF